MIKKITKGIMLSVLTFGTFVQSVSAQPKKVPNPIDPGTLAEVINRVSGFVQPVLVLTLIVIIFIAGFTRLTSAGDAEKEQKSVKILTSAVIGFFIVVLAPLIIKIVGSILGIKDLLIP